MRCQIRRAGRMAILFLSLLVLLAIFTGDTVLFHIFRTGSSRPLHHQADAGANLNNQQELGIGGQGQVTEDVEETVRNELVEIVGEGDPEGDYLMPEHNDGLNGMYVLRKDSPAKPLQMYDWTTMTDQYFRGHKLPDDMLAMSPPRYLSDYKNPCFLLLHPQGEMVVRGDVRAGLKCLPYFHLIGVDKSGTTDLWFRLAHHPQVVQNSGVLGKETHWWSWRRFGFDIWVRNAPIRHFDWYLSHFDEAGKKIRASPVTTGNTTFHPLITGEGSPTVFWDFTGWDLIPQNARRRPENALVTPVCIRHLTPGAKLILMLRNPVERLYSEYLFLDRFKSHHNISAQLFHEGVVQSVAMYEACLTRHTLLACLYNKTLHMALPVRIMVGMYPVWLRKWYAAFPRHQILILRNEDYARDLPSHMARVFQFLELSPLGERDMERVLSPRRAFQRSASEKAVGDMLPATRQILTHFYQPFNQQLAAMLHDQKFLWQ